MVPTYARALALSAAIGLASLLGPATAGAATTIGETFTPPAGGCGNATDLQTSSPGSSYAAPSDGVITSWSHQANATPPQLALKVARAAGGSFFTIVGESASEAMTADTLNSFPTRIPVKAGDVIGFYVVATGSCDSAGPVAGFDYHYQFLDLASGVTAELFGGGDRQLDVSAELEPDADQDGYGDETQDLCPTDAAAHGACPATPPSTFTPGTNPATGRRAAALSKCKRLKKGKGGKERRRKCMKKARRRPV